MPRCPVCKQAADLENIKIARVVQGATIEVELYCTKCKKVTAFVLIKLERWQATIQ